MTVVVRPLERALRALRARFLGVAVLEGILAGVSAGVGVFLTGVTLHAFGGLSYSARIVSLVLSVIAFAGVFSVVFWVRVFARGTCRARGSRNQDLRGCTCGGGGNAEVIHAAGCSC